MATGRNPEVIREHLARTIQQGIVAALLDHHTNGPGLVQKYDQETRRAEVLPAFDLVFNDGSSMPRAVIVDIPIVWPSPSGYVIQGPLRRNELVLMLVCERDITAIKASLNRGPPADPRMFSMIDSVAIAGFGALETTIPGGHEDALTVQTVDGMTYMALKPEEIVLRTTGASDNASITITPAGIVLDGARIDFNPTR